MTPEPSRKTRGKLLSRFPLTSFIVLSYLFFVVSLLIIALVLSLTEVSPLVMGLLIAFGSWTPNAAAMVVSGVTEGRDGVRRLFAGWTRWRVSGWWYLFGVAPVGVALITGGLYSLFSEGAGAQGGSGITVSSILLMFVLHTIQGATGEELGWRGFALPRLQRRFSSLVSAVILGAVISGWHGILHLVSPTGLPEWQFIVVLISYSIIVTWAYNKSRGSVLIATIFHFSFNFSLELVAGRLSLIGMEELFRIRLIVYVVIAVGLIIVAGKNLSAKSPAD